MKFDLLLQLGLDIPFAEAQVEVRQPSLTEIAMIDESTVYNACFLINFSKDNLSEEDRIGLEDKTNFEIFMSIMCSKEAIKTRNEVLMLLTLLFPNYNIDVNTDKIILTHHKSGRVCCIDYKNYDVFKDIIIKIFCLDEVKSNLSTYNPADERARKIAEKLSKNKTKSDKNKKGMGSIFSYYISVLSVGLQKDKNSFKNYTVYQLLDEFQRFQAKLAYDGYAEARMAGCENLDEVDHWMKDNIHS